MITRVLIPLNWILWTILLGVVLYSLVWVSTGRSSSAEGGRSVGVVAILGLLALLAGAAFLLNLAARKQSAIGLVAMTLVLLWPVASLVPSLIGSDRKSQGADAQASVGDFEDPALDAMARAIVTNDSAALTRLLAGKRPPEGTDRAGNDLLGYAATAVRDREGWSAPVRALLAAGADPRTTTMSTGENVVSYLVMGRREPVFEALDAMFEHGADPNVVDPRTGNTPLGALHDNLKMARMLVEHGADIDRIQADGTPPIVRFIATRQWESALYLIEKGARLDVVNGEGLSVDYYLNDWKESVFGQHPEGWDKVRDAIAARRATTS